MLLAKSDTATWVTSRLSEAYLACPTKCYLLSIGEVETANDFAIWRERRCVSYRLDGIQRLTADHSQTIDGGELDPSRWKRALSPFALNQTVRTQNCEAYLHAVQRIHSEGTVQSAQFIPIYFVPNNKLSRPDKLTAVFGALALAKALAAKVDTAKIIHGDKGTTFRIKTNTLSRIVNKAIGQTANLLSSSSPPDLILNRHCPECGFQDRCRMKALEKDDLRV